jgi:outer membrane protein assembly factor BamB
MNKILILMLVTTALLAPLECFGADGVRFLQALTVYADDQGGSLKNPEGVACRDNVIVVADTDNGRLVRYTLDNDQLAGGHAFKVPQIGFPLRLHLNSQGEIFVLDGKTRKVFKLDPNGTFIGTIEASGLPDGTTPILRSFALDRQDNIYLLDVFGARVIVLDPAGKFQRQFPFPADIGFISDLCVGPTGTIYILDSVKSRLYSVAAEGKELTPLGGDLKEYLTFATAIYCAKDGTLLLVDHNGSGIVMLGPEGSYRGRQLTMGWKPGLLYYPTQICLTNDDQAVVADKGNSRVQIFKLER